MAHKVQVIIGSVRAGRVCPQIGGWVADVMAQDGRRPDMVDLLDWPLSMSDEPGIPARDGYTLDSTKAWSRKIAEGDAYVFVTPQYNWGYPAVLKNALDHLYREWDGKPAVIVSYGFHGGDKCAAQLRQVLEGLKMRPTPTMPALVLKHEMFTPEGRLGDPAGDFAPHRAAIEQVAKELAASLFPTG